MCALRDIERWEDALVARWRRVVEAVGWGALIGWLPMIISYAFAVQTPDKADFGMLYAAAETLRFSPHANIYSMQTLSATVQAHGGCGIIGPYPYQPLLALFLQPLTLIPCHTADTYWLIFNLALWLGICMFSAYRVWRLHGSGRALLVAMITMFFLPILTGIAFGSVHLVMLAIMLAGIVLIEDGHDVMGGIALGLGATLKYFPAFLILYYLLRGRWRAVTSASITALALILVEWLIVGRDVLLASIGAASSAVRAGATGFQGGHWMGALPGGVALAYLAGTTFIVVVVWLQRRPETSRGDLTLGAGWAIATMLLLSPLVWWSYMTWLLPTLLACLDVALRYASQPLASQGWRAWAARWWPLATGFVAYALLLIPQINANFREQALGTMLLWLLCGALYLWSAGVRLSQIVGHPVGRPVRA